jgi:hypothetical protein
MLPNDIKKKRSRQGIPGVYTLSTTIVHGEWGQACVIVLFYKKVQLRKPDPILTKHVNDDGISQQG